MASSSSVRTKSTTSANRKAPESEQNDFPSHTIINLGLNYEVLLIDSTTVVKFIPSSFSPSSQALQALTTAATLHSLIPPHPHIVTLKSYTSKDGLHFEYAVNRSIDRYLTSRTPRPFTGIWSSNYPTETKRLAWTQGAALGLAHIHKSGVVHGDISMENILLDRNLSVKISGLGHGRILDVASSGSSTHNNSASSSSSPSPEGDNKNLIKADIFALGTAIYEIMTGRPPFPELDNTDPDDKQETIRRLRAGKFPAMDSMIAGGSVAYKCWAGFYESAEEVDKDLEMCVDAVWGNSFRY